MLYPNNADYMYLVICSWLLRELANWCGDIIEKAIYRTTTERLSTADSSFTFLHNLQLWSTAKMW